MASENFYDVADAILEGNDFERSLVIDQQLEDIKINYLNDKNYIIHNRKSIDYINNLMTLLEYFSKKGNSMFYAELLKEISIKNNNYGMEYYYQIVIGLKEDNQENKEFLEENYKIAIKYAIMNKNEDTIFSLYNSLVWHYVYADDYIMAMRNIASIEKYVKSTLNKIRFFELKFIYYYNLSNFEEALDMLKKQDYLMNNDEIDYKTIENKNNIIVTKYFHYSVVYSKLEDYDNAIFYANKLIAYVSKVNDPYILIQGYTGLLYAKLNKNITEGSLELFDKIDTILNENDVKSRIFIIVNKKTMMALYYKKTKQYKKLLEHLIEFEKFSAKEDPYGMPEVIEKLAEAYMLNGLYEEALKYKEIEVENMENKLNDKIISVSTIINEEVDNNIIAKEKKRLDEKLVIQEGKMLKTRQREEMIVKNFYINLIVFFSILILCVLLYSFYNKNKRLIYKDYLTGLPNRKYIRDKINYLSKKNKDISVILLDLDYFKNINDSYGHDIGDEVLKIIKEVIYSAIRKGDIVARVGGEEFLVLAKNNKTVMQLAERIREAIENYDYSDIKEGLVITASLGIGTNVAAKSYEDIFQEADENLYKAKNSGRNKVVY